MSSRKKPLPLKLAPKALQDFIDIRRCTDETWGLLLFLRWRRLISHGLRFRRLAKQVESAGSSVRTRC